MDYWQIPAFILVIISIFAMFSKINRSYSRLEKTVETHAEVIKKCGDLKSVSFEECTKSQKDCREQQANENLKILQAISDMSKKFEKSQMDIQHKFEDRQQKNHDELMKINKSLGRIEGVVGRHKFDE